MGLSILKKYNDYTTGSTMMINQLNTYKHAINMTYRNTESRKHYVSTANQRMYNQKRISINFFLVY